MVCSDLGMIKLYMLISTLIGMLEFIAALVMILGISELDKRQPSERSRLFVLVSCLHESIENHAFVQGW